MEVGDSFFVAGKRTFNAQYSFVKSKEGAGKQFVARRVTEQGGVFGVRVWRVK